LIHCARAFADEPLFGQRRFQIGTLNQIAADFQDFLGAFIQKFYDAFWRQRAIFFKCAFGEFQRFIPFGRSCFVKLRRQFFASRRVKCRKYFCVRRRDNFAADDIFPVQVHTILKTIQLVAKIIKISFIVISS
jgi:hypothetical protein